MSIPVTWWSGQPCLIDGLQANRDPISKEGDIAEVVIWPPYACAYICMLTCTYTHIHVHLSQGETSGHTHTKAMAFWSWRDPPPRHREKHGVDPCVQLPMSEWIPTTEAACGISWPSSETNITAHFPNLPGESSDLRCLAALIWQGETYVLSARNTVLGLSAFGSLLEDQAALGFLGKILVS